MWVPHYTLLFDVTNPRAVDGCWLPVGVSSRLAAEPSEMSHWVWPTEAPRGTIKIWRNIQLVSEFRAEFGMTSNRSILRPSLSVGMNVLCCGKRTGYIWAIVEVSWNWYLLIYSRSELHFMTPEASFSSSQEPSTEPHKFSALGLLQFHVLCILLRPCIFV